MIPLEKRFQNLIPHDGFLRFICDGWQAREHEESDDRAINLKILAYFDEIELCNPLGSHTKIHKLGVFYFTLANFHPMFRSKLNSIYLFAVVKSCNLSRYGFNKVLQPFVDDMKKLARGLAFTVKLQEMCVKGSLLLFLADTLAAHQLGGFKIGVGFSLRKCRNCHATSDDMDEKFHHGLFLPRFPDLHRYHCSLLEGNLASFNSTTYGVCYNSSLNEIPLFNVTDWQLPQDIMHVLLEGVLPLEIKLLLYNFTSIQKLFSVDDFNSRLEAFQFGYSESKPSRIDLSHLSDGNLHQSASQCWTLGRFLPLLIADLVPPDDRFWECFLYLHDILAICMSPCISPMTISYLPELIRIHLSLLKDCYSSVRITPKLHYMVHLPEQIRRFGPLVRYWCMRMEAKNAYTKKAASRGNFKNVTLSFAQRHQRLLSFYLTNPKIMSLDYTLGPGSCSSIQLEKAPSALVAAVQRLVPDVKLSDYLYRSKWVKLGHLEYRPGVIIFTGFHGILPKFTKVNEILSIHSKPLLKVSECITLGLDEHYRSYLISEANEEVLFSLYDLPDYSIMHIHHSFSQTDHSSYICLKWSVETPEK